MSLTGDGAARDIDELEDEEEAPGHPEPTPVGGSHIVQDNVTDPENPTTSLVGAGAVVQDNVTDPGMQHTIQADGTTSSFETPLGPVTAAPAEDDEVSDAGAGDGADDGGAGADDPPADDENGDPELGE